MKCPKCQSEDFKITNTHLVGACEKSQRAECSHCGTIAALKTELVAINPPRGQGAAAIANRMRQLNLPTATS